MCKDQSRSAVFTKMQRAYSRNRAVPTCSAPTCNTLIQIQQSCIDIVDRTKNATTPEVPALAPSKLASTIALSRNLSRIASQKRTLTTV